MNRVILVLSCLILSAVSSAGPGDISIESLHWLSGEWVGEGREGDDGDVQGVARLYWSSPAEGSISNYFVWHSAAAKHVHYAITVFEETDDGLLGKGIHYGRNFENFEEHPWQLRATRTDPNVVEFVCVAHCRSDSVTFRLIDDGTLEERWQLQTSEQKPDWIVRYRRSE